MPRLFTALWPAPPAVEDLSAAVARLPRERVERATADLGRFRFLPPERWHLTLRFHGAAEPEPLAARLDERVAELTARPRMRLAGSGVFRGVLWVGAEPAGEADAAALRELVRAADGDPETFRAHLTIARWSAGRPRGLAGLLEAYAGPWWEAAEAALVRSDQDHTGSTYRTLHRAGLPSANAGEPGDGPRP